MTAQQPEGGQQPITAGQWDYRLQQVMSGQAWGQPYDEATARLIVTREYGERPAGDPGMPPGQGANGGGPPAQAADAHQLRMQAMRLALLTDEERGPEFGSLARAFAWPAAIDILENGTQPADIARVIAKLSRRKLVWDPKYAEWLAWTGTHWQVSDDGWEEQHQQARRLRDTARKIAGNVTDGLDDSANCLADDPGPEKLAELGITLEEYQRPIVADLLAGVVKRLATKSMQRDILGQVASHHGIMVRLDDFTGRRNVLNFGNCTAALDHDAWWEHNPEDLVTHCLPYRYNPQAACPQFLALVHRMTGPAADQSPEHLQMAEFVLAVLGYCLIHGNPAQLVFFLTGPTKTGKTTVIEIVARLLGEQLAHKSKPVLVTVPRTGDTHDSVRWSIRGRRLVYVDETKAEMRIDVSALKDLSGSRTVPVRKMRGSSEVPTEVTWAIVIPTNQMPSMVGGDDAVAERLIRVPCRGRTIPAAERDPALADKIIAAEAEGILALLVARARRYYACGLPVPAAVQEASAEYMASQDSATAFREDRCSALPLPGQQYAWIARPALFRTYEDWCGGKGRGLGRNEFYEAVRKMPGIGETKDSHGTDVFTGIRLKESYE